MKRIVFTQHALERIKQRNLEILFIRRVLQDPDSVLDEREEKIAYYKAMGNNLLKIICREESQTIIVITAYFIAKQRTTR